jgi:hypothetical protein
VSGGTAHGSVAMNRLVLAYVLQLQAWFVLITPAHTYVRIAADEDIQNAELVEASSLHH